MKKLLITSFILLGTACTATPDDLAEPDRVEGDQGVVVEAPPVAAADDVDPQSVTPLSATCEWYTAGCCNRNHSAYRVYRCWGVGGWRNISGTGTCATNLACAF